MIESDFRPIVQKKLTDLTSGEGLKVAFEVNGIMKGTSISEGGDVDVLFSPRKEVMYIDYIETVSSKNYQDLLLNHIGLNFLLTRMLLKKIAMY